MLILLVWLLLYVYIQPANQPAKQQQQQQQQHPAVRAMQNLTKANIISSSSQAKAALPALRQSKGKIILTSSGAAVTGYRGWALYGATKAAMNHFALSLGAEEPDVTSVSIRPGMVDTNMQRELREDHATSLDAEMHSKFTGVHKDGKLLRVEQPGHVMAKLVLDAPRELSGKFLS